MREKELLKPIEKESINHPSHYNMGGMECIDEMIMIFGKKWTMIFCIMNAWKYRNTEKERHIRVRWNRIWKNPTGI